MAVPKRRGLAWPFAGKARQDLGHRGEAEAVSHLRGKGYRIVSVRERILRGDIDIVALDERTVVFVEVRSRSSTAHGHPVETIGWQKQRRIAELANAYIRRHRLEDCSVRIDVVTVTFPPDGEPRVEHFQNAFESL